MLLPYNFVNLYNQHFIAGPGKCNEISTLTVNCVRIISHIMYVTNQIQKAFTEWNKHKIIHSSVWLISPKAMNEIWEWRDRSPLSNAARAVAYWLCIIGFFWDFLFPAVFFVRLCYQPQALIITGSNPVEALIFFRLLLSNCLNWKIYCDDHISLSKIPQRAYPLDKLVCFANTYPSIWFISQIALILSIYWPTWSCSDLEHSKSWNLLQQGYRFCNRDLSRLL